MTINQSWFTPDWHRPDNITAYVSTRLGPNAIGPEDQIYSHNNIALHVGDEPSRVLANRALLPFSERLCWLNQTHSNTCVTLPSITDTADAAVSRDPQYWCAVMTADCIPILVTNKVGTEVAAIHAGWKGLLNGVIENALRAMHSDPQGCIAWIGPAICQNCFEVEAEFAKKFAQWPHAIDTYSAEKAHINLPEIARDQLIQAGIAAVSLSNLCTYESPSIFYSHRRAQHEGAVSTGRMVSVIGINNTVTASSFKIDKR